MVFFLYDTGRVCDLIHRPSVSVSLVIARGLGFCGFVRGVLSFRASFHAHIISRSM